MIFEDFIERFLAEVLPVDFPRTRDFCHIGASHARIASLIAAVVNDKAAFNCKGGSVWDCEAINVNAFFQRLDAHAAHVLCSWDGRTWIALL